MGDAVRNEKPQVDPGRLTGDTGDAGELQAEPSAATGVASPNTFVALTESTLVTPQSSNAGISERFHRAALTHDWQQTLKRGVEAESQYLLATNSGVDDGLRLRWIIQVCDALQSYEPCAADLNRVYLWQSQAVRAALADESLREIHTQIREVSAALQHDLKWLKELLDLAVRYRFTPMLSSLVEARQRNRWPHELDSFDWPQFRRELLAVRDEVHHRLTEATGDGGTNETPAAPSRGAKPVEVVTGVDGTPLLLNDVLLNVLENLKGKALKVEKLAQLVTGGDSTRLYRAGLKTVLQANGLVGHKHGVGWYSTTFPPPERVIRTAKSTAKN